MIGFNSSFNLSCARESLESTVPTGTPSKEAASLVEYPLNILKTITARCLGSSD